MKNKQIIEKLIQYIEKILFYTKEMEYEDFLNNSMALEACVFNLSQMGELVKKIDKSYERAHENIPWRQLYGLRNKIVHDYEGVNFSLVWSIIDEDLPALKEELKKLTNGNEMENNYLSMLKEHVLDQMKNEDVRIYLFGSWAKGVQRKTSDIDIAIEYRNGQDNGKITQLRENIEESNLPYRVDVVDMQRIGEKLAEKIRREGVVWKD